MKTPRTLAIEDFNPTGCLCSGSTASQIRLKGRWLKQTGFHSGARVKVSNPSTGVIELRVYAPAQIEAFYFTPIQQLDAVLK
jgi:hypothetical protein